MEKTTFVKKLAIETKAVLPRTLEVVTEAFHSMKDVEAAMYVVYGRDEDERKVWCATFYDSDEAMAWVHGSRTFGRPVMGAVMAGQKPVETTDAGIPSGEPASQPN